jgi:hypothetical protein
VAQIKTYMVSGDKITVELFPAQILLLCSVMPCISCLKPGNSVTPVLSLNMIKLLNNLNLYVKYFTI